MRNATRESILARNVALASDACARAKGLLGRASLEPDEGLWIERCSAVHTIGMRATLDLLFLDRQQRVLRIVFGVRPNRLAIVCWGAASVVELGASDSPRDVVVGDVLMLGESDVPAA